MKKFRLLSLVLALVLIVICFTACGDKTDNTTTNTITTKSQISDTTKSTQISFEKNKFEKDGVSVEFIKINGMTDERLQVRLNQKIKDFYTWQWVNPDPEDTSQYTATAKYYCKGNYLSVVRILDTTAEGVAYPTSELSSQVFDLSTGDVVDTILVSGKDVKALADKFTMSHPDAEIPNAKEQFTSYLNDNDMISTCYFTDSGIAIFIPNLTHAEGDYWLFEASYEDVSEILTKEAAAQLK